MADDAHAIERPRKVYDFAALSRREPNRQQPGDRLDAQFDNVIAAVNALASALEGLKRPLAFADLPDAFRRDLVGFVGAHIAADAADVRAALVAAHMLGAELERNVLDRVSRAFDGMAMREARLNAFVQAFDERVTRLENRALDAPPQSSVFTNDTVYGPVLGPNAGGFYGADVAGATSTASDYAQVAIEWAERMPDTIPPNILAINAITGDHWSSRWWANRAASFVAILGAGSLGLTAEPVTVTAANTFAPLQHQPYDGLTTMEVIVNGRTFSACAAPAPFYVSGAQLVWTSTLYSVNPGDEVIARYRYAVSTPVSGDVVAVSLYYLATQGQTSFNLGNADHFGNVYTLRPTSVVTVYRNGARLMPDYGAGDGGFRVVANAVTLLWPAGQGESVAVDVMEKTS